MNFYLTNEHRKYMGLKPIKDNYELVKVKKGEFKEFYLFFDGNRIVKLIDYFISNQYINMHERDIDYETIENRTIVLPKTNRGKKRKLTGSVAESLDGQGNYFTIEKDFSKEYGNAIIANYTTQKTFYEDFYVEKCNSLSDIENWCNKYVLESTEQDLKDVQNFIMEKRQHIPFKAGDYFRVKLGRNKYTYGRILLDVYKGEKNKTLNYWDIVMGRPVIIEVFHILTTRKDVSINELKALKTFPSQHILNNYLYYGDYEIIGHDELPELISYPIMYGKGIYPRNTNKIIFQCGPIHIEKTLDKNNYYGEFLNNDIGFYIHEDERLIEKCLKEKSNKPYWEKYPGYNQEDLRSPANRDILMKILNEYELYDLIKLYDQKYI